MSVSKYSTSNCHCDSNSNCNCNSNNTTNDIDIDELDKNCEVEEFWGYYCIVDFSAGKPICVPHFEKHQVRQWINYQLGTSYKSLRQLHDGVAWGSLMARYFPHSMKDMLIHRDRTQMDYLFNLLLLRLSMRIAKIDLPFDIIRILRGDKREMQRIGQFFMHVDERPAKLDLERFAQPTTPPRKFTLFVRSWKEMIWSPTIRRYYNIPIPISGENMVNSTYLDCPRNWKRIDITTEEGLYTGTERFRGYNPDVIDQLLGRKKKRRTFF